MRNNFITKYKNKIIFLIILVKVFYTLKKFTIFFLILKIDKRKEWIRIKDYKE